MKKKVLFLCVLLLSVFVVAGCEKGGNKAVVGEYKIVEAVEGETTIKGSDLEKYGIKYTLSVKDNGTAVLEMSGEKEDLKYDGKYFYSKSDKSDKVPYTYKDGKLTLAQDGLSMTFEKK